MLQQCVGYANMGYAVCGGNVCQVWERGDLSRRGTASICE